MNLYFVDLRLVRSFPPLHSLAPPGHKVAATGRRAKERAFGISRYLGFLKVKDPQIGWFNAINDYSKYG